MYFMLKNFPNISLRDLDPEGMIRNEDLVGLKQVEIWYQQKADKESKRNEARARTKANLKNK
jgi:hypothetical protein